jgi:hypothetical protein
LRVEAAAVELDLHRLELAQPFVHARLHVLLGALQFGHLAGQLLVLPAQTGDLAAQLLDLVGQLEQAALDGRVVVAGLFGGGVGRQLVGLDLLAQVDDGLAGLVVAEDGVRGGRPGSRQGHQPGTQPMTHARAAHGRHQR